MSIRTFDFCALQFLNQWLEKESHYCDALAQDSPEIQRMALVGAAAHFRIARNLPTRYEMEHNLQRYQPVIEILNGLAKVTPANVVDVIEETCEAVSEHYGNRRVLSLVTKFLWLKVKSPVRIYDRQARIALGTPEGDFSSFNEQFSTQLDIYTEQIDQACANLESVLPYTIKGSVA